MNVVRESQVRAQAMVADAHGRRQIHRGMDPGAVFDADREWFRRHRGERERVRPATVEEQTDLFKEHGGEVFDNVRVTEEIVVDRGFFFVHVLDPV